ncbi:MAG TPA: GIY-YIG nuclease family protein [Bacteroidales bacterium]|nr:GIY-YIG nuclease family protein [Bacteroidales bacterium]
MYTLYILYSESFDRFYVGYTNDIERRLSEHNRKKGKFTDAVSQRRAQKSWEEPCPELSRTRQFTKYYEAVSKVSYNRKVREVSAKCAKKSQ